LSQFGLLTNLLVALTIIAFRQLVERAQIGLFSMDRPEDFRNGSENGAPGQTHIVTHISTPKSFLTRRHGDTEEKRLKKQGS